MAERDRGSGQYCRIRVSKPCIQRTFNVFWHLVAAKGCAYLEKHTAQVLTKISSLHLNSHVMRCEKRLAYSTLLWMHGTRFKALVLAKGGRTGFLLIHPLTIKWLASGTN